LKKTSPDLLAWAPFGHIRCTEDGVITAVNPALVALLDRRPEEIVGRGLEDVFHEPANATGVLKVLQSGQEIESDRNVFRASESRPVPVLVSGRTLRSDEGGPVFELIVLDISERVTLQQELRQAQKLDAIGRLAGGMAHDFNNLLMIVQGRSELALKVLETGHPAIRHLYSIHRTAAQAESLTRQLLAFSRNQTLQSRVMSLNDVVAETRDLIHRWLGEDIIFRSDVEPALWPVRGDTIQMQQVLVNLVLNARDAMPQGGTLSIRTLNVPEHDYGDPARALTDSVLLEIRDSGRGIDEETLGLIFEPFFTTKGRGKGTGLGLSTAYGVITQSNGSIQVESTPGKGTVFRIYLPRTEGTVERRAHLAGSPGTGLQPLHRPGVVLLVESHHDLRLIIRSFLEDMGHHVIAAADAEAVLASMADTEKVDILVTEVVLPSMSGPDLAFYIREERPDLPVIFMTGSIDHPLVEKVREGEETLLLKPFTHAVLDENLRVAMGQTRTD
jgi:two-component system, cell cycle sensor histidine kinase and response regulator CckA